MSGLDARKAVGDGVLDAGHALVEFLDDSFEASFDGAHDGLVALVGGFFAPVGAFEVAGDFAERLVIGHDHMVTVSLRLAKSGLSRVDS